MKVLALLTLALAPVRAEDLLVAAASDLAPLQQPLEAAASRALGIRVRFALGSSGSLAVQIRNGAPYDVYLAAGESYVTDLVKGGFLDPATVETYAYGRIALWSKDGSVRSFDDLRKATVRHIAIPNPEHAPYGVAARQALEKRGLWKEAEPKIVYGENVRQAMEFAESGNADAVITSWTLLMPRGILLPADWHQPVKQTGAALKSSTQPENARRFLKFLASAEGKRILAAGGLFPP